MPTVAELRSECKQLGLTRYSALRKAELIEFLEKSKASKLVPVQEEKRDDVMRTRKRDETQAESDEALRSIQKKLRFVRLTKECSGVPNYDKDGQIGWLNVLIHTSEFKQVCSTIALAIDVVNWTHEPIVSTRKNTEFVLPTSIKSICHKGKASIFVIPLHIHSVSSRDKAKRNASSKEDENHHANVLLVNKHLKTVEYFEPHGYVDRQGNQQKSLIEFVRTKVLSHLKLSDYRLVTPYDDCPLQLGPQSFVKLAAALKPCITGGYCRTYVAIYVHLRLLSPESIPSDTIKSLTDLGANELLLLVLRYITMQQNVIAQFSKKVIE